MRLRAHPFALSTELSAVPQEMIGEHNGEHGFPDRDGANSHARIVADTLLHYRDWRHTL